MDSSLSDKLIISSSGFRLLFAVVVLCAIGTQIVCPMHWAHLATKIMIMLSLGVATTLDTRMSNPGLKYFMMAAIVLALGGDVLLSPRIDLFLPGLIAFLLAHIFYIICFLKVPARPLEVPFIRRNPWAIFLMILFGGWLFLKLRTGAGELAWAVLVYILVISIMTLTALNREKTVPVRSFRYVAIGAILFMVSDSILAWNKFLEDITYAPVWVLGTYGAAQLAIVTGLVQQLRDEV